MRAQNPHFVPVLKSSWKISDPNHAVMEECRYAITMSQQQDPSSMVMECKISDVLVQVMLLQCQHLHKLNNPKTVMPSSRKGSQQMGLLQEVGVLMILSCRGRSELPAIGFTLLKAELKGLSRRVFGGLRTGVLPLSMVGGD